MFIMRRKQRGSDNDIMRRTKFSSPALAEAATTKHSNESVTINFQMI